MPHRVLTGLETLKQTPLPELEGKRLGLLANPASVTSDFTHARTLIQQRFPGQLKALFSPQHGFFAEKQDNMIESGHGRDPELDIPIFSLYSETRIPTPEMFDPIDTLLIDIQDVGTRVYTFIYTISHCMEMAAQCNKEIVILDRPNPIGGIQVEGNLLEDEFTSFVGRYPIPMRHGMTVGEISQFFNTTFNINCELSVIPMEGWHRGMYWEDTGLPWIPPSPNLPTPLSCAVYPGQVIYEGTQLSEGRGTTLPFEQFGAPYLDLKAIQGEACQLIKGAHLRPVHFEPTSGKHGGKICRGFHIHVTDRREFRPYFASLSLLRLIQKHHHQEFEYKQPPYEYEFDRLPMDLILGSQRLRCAIEAQADIGDLASEWQREAHAFKTESRAFYLYD
ncbi:MAG: DUF1343 domain-containing protein [Desulfobacterales bacterium]|nr:DUF1343 domain-containing protein [Desulfobacterales bacterium]